LPRSGLIKTDFTVKLPGGKLRTPQFAENIHESRCIDCGCRFRDCCREVLHLVGLTEDVEHIKVCSDPDSDDYDDDDAEYEKEVMAIANPGNFVGREACMTICPKKCYTHGPVPVTG